MKRQTNFTKLHPYICVTLSRFLPPPYLPNRDDALHL